MEKPVFNQELFQLTKRENVTRVASVLKLVRPVDQVQTGASDRHGDLELSGVAIAGVSAAMV
jgi:hypothetical protein